MFDVVHVYVYGLAKCIGYVLSIIKKDVIDLQIDLNTVQVAKYHSNVM